MTAGGRTIGARAVLSNGNLKATILKLVGPLKEAPQPRAPILVTRDTKEKLVENIICGLPGAAEHFTLEDVLWSVDACRERD